MPIPSTGGIDPHVIDTGAAAPATQKEDDMTKRILPIGAAAIFAITAGALVATAQTAPVPQAAPDAMELPITQAHMPGGGMDHREDRGPEKARGHHGPEGARGHHGPRPDGHGRPGDRGPRGAMEREDRGLPARFSEIDRDGDGAIRQADIDAFVASQRDGNDADGDGAISIDEFEAIWLERTRPMMADAFQRLDADASGEITEAELAERFGGLVERMDRDGDGALTLQRRGMAPAAPASQNDADSPAGPADE